jgi:hypothetical protein
VREYAIVIGPLAEQELRELRAFDQRAILDAIAVQLTRDPLSRSKNKKPLDPPPAVLVPELTRRCRRLPTREPNMIRRQPPVANKRTTERTAREQKLARARRFWIDLNARLAQAEKHGISFAEATRRLEKREAKGRGRRRSGRA